MSPKDKDKDSLAPDPPKSLRRRSTTSLFHPEDNTQNLPTIELDDSSEIGTNLATLHLEPTEVGQPPPKLLEGLCFHRKCPYKHPSAMNPKLALEKAREVMEELEKGATLSEEFIAYLKEPQGRTAEEDRHSPVCPVTKSMSKAASKVKEGLGKAQLAPPPHDISDSRK